MTSSSIYTIPVPLSPNLQPVTSNPNRSRVERSPLTFPTSEVLQKRECWPVRATREDPNMVTEPQDAVARLFGRLDRNIREIIVYSNERMIPETSTEEMASNFGWHEYELINELKRTLDELGRDGSFFRFFCLVFSLSPLLLIQKKWNLQIHDKGGYSAALIKK
ncbi:hypothetical protein O181_010825 [Austropuccinia psidii MF-1]|uniref:Uncharacterized protein n=1 Tax=Austropuccinia psidii MF-1 TaxID=1389203 RepID=A0A9Q3BU03_9BASI|nr:hypothetical protein [Austropuccinia psidii MF-1]